MPSGHQGNYTSLTDVTPGFRLIDPNADQVPRQIVTATQGVQGLAGVVFGDNLSLELGAVASVAFRHGLPSYESPRPVNSVQPICPPLILPQ